MIRFKRIGHRLAASYATLLAVLLISSLLTGLQLQGIGAAKQAMTDDARRLALVSEWTLIVRSNLDRAVTATRLEAAAGDDAAVKQRLAGMVKQLGEEMSASALAADKASRETASITQDGPGGLKPLVNQVSDDSARFVSLRTKIADELQMGEGVARINKDLMPLAQAMGTSLDRLQHALVERSAASGQDLTQRLEHAQMALVLACVIGLVAGSLLAWSMTLAITAPLTRATAFAGGVARGDLSAHLPIEGSDEIATLQCSLGGMQDSLRGLVEQVRDSADHIRVASAEVASSTLDLSQRTEAAAASLQQSSSDMSQISSVVRQSADAAAQAHQLAASASAVAQRGGSHVAQVVTTMNEIRSSSRRIADITGVIDDIAFQTNILALNAAVEAARAGEQGRGFAVVASEVRSLAQRSAEAAKEIKSLIGASVERVEFGSRLVADAGNTMTEIVSSVQRVTDIIAEISTAASVQSAGLARVDASVGGLEQATQQNAALVEQNAAAAESLREQALHLAEVVGRFQLSAASFSAPAPTQFSVTPSSNGPPGLGKSVPHAHLAQSVVQRAAHAAPTALAA